MKTRLLLAAVAGLVSASPVYAMDVGTFLAKAGILQERGVLAVFASEYGELQAEVRTSFSSLKQERLAARAASRRQAYCPPGPATLDTPELIAALTAVPETRRARTQVRDVMRVLLARKYPCAG